MTRAIRKSDAYIAQGMRDGVHVMKVGKSNNVARRQNEIGITIERIEQCISEAAAYRFENDLRRFVIKEGGVRYKNTVDWFRFDERIYKLLLESFNKFQTQPAQTAPLLSEDQEIQLYRQKYYQLLKDSLDAQEIENFRLQQKIIKLEKRVDEVREEERALARAHEKELFNKIKELSRQVGRLEARLEWCSEHQDTKA